MQSLQNVFAKNFNIGQLHEDKDLARTEKILPRTTITNISINMCKKNAQYNIFLQIGEAVYFFLQKQ